jgi:hypothetical protein
MEAILPAWLHHIASPSLFKNRSLWFGFRTGFMIGWQVQQLVKMQMAFAVSDDGLLYCDSDVFFVRPFNVESLQSQGRFRFYRTENLFTADNAPNQSYVVSASRQLGLGSDPFPCPSYIDNIVAWHAPRRWHSAIIWKKHPDALDGSARRYYIISEYSLYGLCRPSVGDRRHLLNQAKIFARLSQERANRPELIILAESGAEEVAVGFQSFVGTNIDELLSQLQRAIDPYAMLPAPEHRRTLPVVLPPGIHRVAGEADVNEEHFHHLLERPRGPADIRGPMHAAFQRHGNGQHGRACSCRGAIEFKRQRNQLISR